MDPKTWYGNACEQAGFVSDEAQARAIEELEILWQQLIDFKQKREGFLGRSLLSPDVPKGLYIWGGVGRGKTFLMDGFYSCLPYRRKRRMHFHHFMAEVHQQMKRLSSSSDPLMALAENIARQTRLLCLDELHVDDIADAMILGRLLRALFKRGVVVLTTSNYAPDDLYPNGLQRQNFLPAIELLKSELKVLHFDGNRDYRMLNMARDPVFMAAGGSDARMESLFGRLSAASGASFIEVGSVRIPVRCEGRDAVWFCFAELCGGNHDQSDYLAIARRYQTVFLSDVPRMTPDNAASARRFTWLIDVLYDHGVKLVASFEVTPETLYEPGWKMEEFQRIASRLAQMQTPLYLEQAHRGKLTNPSPGEKQTLNALF